MSQQNVEHYRRTIDAWNRGALDEWLETITPQWEFVLTGTFPGMASIYRGREGALAYWDAARGPWEEGRFDFELNRIEDLGETVLGLGTLRARGKESGVEVELRWAHVVTYDGDAIVARNYASWEEALGAAGLRE